MLGSESHCWQTAGLRISHKGKFVPVIGICITQRKIFVHLISFSKHEGSVRVDPLSSKQLEFIRIIAQVSTELTCRTVESHLTMIFNSVLASSGIVAR